MRIRNRCLLPIYSIHQNDTAALTTNRFPPALPLSPETPPVVMVSSINSRISSKGDTEPENGMIAQVNFSTQANQSCCEEEKVIPLKKRRIGVERNLIPEKKKEINESDVSEETKMEELRCRRTDGKKWRCRRRRVEGYSMCAHHLEREKLSRSSGCRRSRRRNRKKDENEDDKREKKIMKQMEAIDDCDHLDQILLRAQEISQPVLIDWMATWCRKCIYLKPKLGKLAAEFDTKLKFYYVDVNKVPQAIVKRGNISKMPTIQIWKDGEMKSEVIGGHKAWLVIEEVREMIKKFV